MALRIAYAMASFGVSVPAAYVRLHSVGVGTAHGADGALVRGDLCAEFHVYASREAREQRRDPVGQVSVSTPYDETRSAYAQAWEALKGREDFAAGTDDLEPVATAR